MHLDLHFSIVTVAFPPRNCPSTRPALERNKNNRSDVLSVTQRLNLNRDGKVYRVWGTIVYL